MILIGTPGKGRPPISSITCDVKKSEDLAFWLTVGNGI
jgi:hypothetical protein